MAPWPCVAKDDEASDSWVVWSAGFSSGYAPDWTDPATLGCLLGLVREAWGDEAVHCAPALYREGPFEGRVSHWHCYAPRSYNPNTQPKPCAVTGPTEAEALIAALEAAKEGA